MKTSVIVCTKDRALDLKRFIQSLDEQTQLPEELIIVDASEDDETSTLVAPKISSSKYLIKYIKTEPGLTRQRNIGINEAGGKYIFFFDDDVVVDNNFIQTICETFLKVEAQNIGGITGRITNVSVRIDPIDKLFKKMFFLTDHGRGKLKLSGFPAHRVDNQLAFVDIFSGCCMIFARKVFLKHWFDEKLSGYSYMEDIDFSYRVSRDFKLLYQPEAKLKHFSTTYKTTDTRILRRMLVRNHFYLFRKNLPKDLFHLFAFFMSIIGLFLYNALLAKDIRACIGIVEGIAKPL